MKGAYHSLRSRFGLRPAALVALVLCATATVTGCGASIQAIYEADVRFEHCMALDAQPDVTLTARRSCWVEWVSFYTYGQTRDRVLHAQLRIKQLSGDTDFVKSAPEEPLGRVQSSLADGRREKVCQDECDAVHRDCLATCESGAGSCRSGCEAGLRSCTRQCR